MNDKFQPERFQGAYQVANIAVSSNSEPYKRPQLTVTFKPLIFNVYERQSRKERFKVYGRDDYNVDKYLALGWLSRENKGAK